MSKIILNPVHDEGLQLVSNLASEVGLSGLATSITAGKTLTLTAADNYTLTIPATGTAALLGTANVFTTQQMVDGTSDQIQLRVQAHSTQTTNIQTWEKSTGAVVSGVDERGVLFSDLGIDQDSVYLGRDAGSATGTATQNVGIGWRVLSASNVSGSGNVAIGSSVLRICTSGSNNLGIGGSALFSLTTGGSNVAVGNSALFSVVGGGSNIAIGASSLTNIANTDSNIGIGVNAGRYFGTGTSANTAATNSLFIGQTTRANANSETNQIVIGYDALGNGSNTATLGADTITATYLKGLTYSTIRTTTTNAVVEAKQLRAIVSTAATGAANGFGVGQTFYAETATDGTNQLQGLISTSWVDATNATRKAKLSLSAYDTAARLGLEIEASGTEPKIGFYGVAPIARAVLATGAGASVDDVITALQNLGLVKQS